MNIEKKQSSFNKFTISIETDHVQIRIKLQSDLELIHTYIPNDRFSYEKSLLKLPVNKIFELHEKNQLGCATCNEIKLHFSNYRQLTDKIEWFNIANENIRKEYERQVYQIISFQIDSQAPDDIRFQANLYDRLLDSAIQAWNGKVSSKDIIRGTGLNDSIVVEYIDKLIASNLVEETEDGKLTWIAPSKYHRSHSPNGLKAIRARAKAIQEQRK